MSWIFLGYHGIYCLEYHKVYFDELKNKQPEIQEMISVMRVELNQ